MGTGVPAFGNSRGEAHSGGHGDRILDVLGLEWLSGIQRNVYTELLESRV